MQEMQVELNCPELEAASAACDTELPCWVFDGRAFPVGWIVPCIACVGLPGTNIDD